MKITSSAFRYGEVIPDCYTALAENMSPPMEWEGEPEGTMNFAMIVDECDVKGGIENHWILYNIPPTTHSIQANIPRSIKIAEGAACGARNGINDMNHSGYEGPSDTDMLHRYNFKLYALDSEMHLPRTTTRNILKNAMHNHILAEANIMGVYPA